MNYNFPDHINHDTFEGVSFTVLVNNIALNLTGASIRMMLRSQKLADTAVLTLSTVDESIVITNAAAGIFQVKKQIITATPATYFYDIEITLSDGTVKTYVEGTWKILPDVTR